MSARKVIAEVEHRDGWYIGLQSAEAIISALRAAGYVVVPVEPSREMWAASGNALTNGRIKLKAHHDYLSETVWSAMILAAQESSDAQ